LALVRTRAIERAFAGADGVAFQPAGPGRTRTVEVPLRTIGTETHPRAELAVIAPATPVTGPAKAAVARAPESAVAWPAKATFAGTTAKAALRWAAISAIGSAPLRTGAGSGVAVTRPEGRAGLIGPALAGETAAGGAAAEATGGRTVEVTAGTAGRTASLGAAVARGGRIGKGCHGCFGLDSDFGNCRRTAWTRATSPM
jgi:hypothetical protein